MTAGPAGLSSDPDETPVNLRDLGRVRVLEVLNTAGSQSRPELIRRTGLARATVASVVSDLLEARLLTERPPDDGRAGPTGRPPRLVALRPGAACAVGVDIGHDHVRCMVCDLSGDPVADRSVAVDVDDDPDRALTLAADLVTDLVGDRSRTTVLGVGVGVATPLDQRSGELFADGIMPGWVGIRPAEELSARLDLPVRIVNDANAGALAERRYGAARGVGNVIYIRISSGIGIGVLSDGQLLLGAHGLAGELGHVPVEPGGLLCRCGNRGCLETVASPAAVARVVSTSRGQTIDTAALLRLLDAGDRGAIRVLEDAGDAVGRALALTVMILNPELIVVGGELAQAGETLLGPMRHAIGRNAMRSHTSDLRVERGTLGDSAGVRGAAAMVLTDAPYLLAKTLSA